ncbi:hypothetical protein DWB68_12530 [Galactobacter valiniphilus]|uniref:Uncharacterized protein n=1 Tax=Galactobacter valiniphilus TaxID=2676122 RepID=A0A399JBN0_9MICC|nr:hypothetical protein [Galactobacter valiniphilus]RII41442.1 hypothetical protein DWB68_12530 [Galactobacter valiniphilus]
MTKTEMDLVPTQSFEQAQTEADRLHRSGAMTLISLAAFWGIAAALYQWGSPLAGQIALLIGSAAAHPVAWLVLKLAGGPAMVPRSNPLSPLFYQVSAVPLVVTLSAMGLADARPDAFFAGAMLGLAAAFLPSSSLYGRKLYLVLAAVFTMLPVVAWFAAQPLLPWFGLIGVALLLVSGALLLRRLGGLGAAPREGVGHDDAPLTTGGAVASAPAAGGDAGALEAPEAAPRTNDSFFDAEAPAGSTNPTEAIAADRPAWGGTATPAPGEANAWANPAPSGSDDDPLDNGVITDADLDRPNHKPEA